MSQLNVEEKGTVTARMEISMKRRVLQMKTDRTGNKDLPSNVEDIVKAALDDYLKKFGY